MTCMYPTFFSYDMRFWYASAYTCMSYELRLLTANMQRDLDDVSPCYEKTRGTEATDTTLEILSLGVSGLAIEREREIEREVY